VIDYLVGIGGIVDHNSLNFLFIKLDLQARCFGFF